MNMISAMVIAEKLNLFLKQKKTKQIDATIANIVDKEILAEKPEITSEFCVPRKIHGITYKCAGYTIHTACRYRLIKDFYTADITNKDKKMFEVDISDKKLVQKLYLHANQYC